MGVRRMGGLGGVHLRLTTTKWPMRRVAQTKLITINLGATFASSASYTTPAHSPAKMAIAVSMAGMGRSKCHRVISARPVPPKSCFPSSAKNSIESITSTARLVTGFNAFMAVFRKRLSGSHAPASLSARRARTARSERKPAVRNAHTCVRHGVMYMEVHEHVERGTWRYTQAT